MTAKQNKLLADLAARLKINVTDLIHVMWMESKLNPQARNKSSKATGLIQFVPSTATGLGTTVDKLLAMTFEQQLPFVERYLQASFKAKKSVPNNFIELYSHVFYPPFVGKPLTATLPKSMYAANRGVDVDGSGTITKNDLKNWAENRLKNANIIHTAKVVGISILPVLVLTVLFVLLIKNPRPLKG